MTTARIPLGQGFAAIVRSNIPTHCTCYAQTHGGYCPHCFEALRGDKLRKQAEDDMRIVDSDHDAALLKDDLAAGCAVMVGRGKAKGKI